MSVRPLITLLFLLTVATVLLFIAAVFPRKGILLAGHLRLKFISPKEIFSTPHVKYADITAIIEKNKLLTDSIIENIGNRMAGDTLRANADSLLSSIERIQFAKNDRSMLHGAFRSFEKASKSSRPVHVLHYGDSQIEGDRMTSFIRNKLQKKFGGMGPGLIPVEQLYDFSFSLTQKSSKNWLRYTLFGKKDTSVTHDRYGALASFCRFAPYGADTLKVKKSYEAWVTFASSPYSYANTKSFTQCRVFYGNNKEPFIAELYQNNSLDDADLYPATNTLQTIKWKFDEPVRNLKILFKGTSSPDIYGISLDGTSGIAVDNIPMRGNAGVVFTRMNKDLLQKHYKELNVRMVLLQFGGNIVPHIVEDYTYYQNLFQAQIERIQKVAPGAVIIVIGVADMSMREGDRYVSYPNIEKVRNALKTASLNSGAGYWDLYEAMGGKNSMPSWVFADPPLASTDFVHFNPRGAKIIANMFYNALMFEYNQYKNLRQDTE